MMQVDSKIREISCVSLAGFQMKIHCNFEVWRKKFYWCGFCNWVADKDRNGGFRGKFVDNLCAELGQIPPTCKRKR